jgi:hypothetical protein
VFASAMFARSMLIRFALVSLKCFDHVVWRIGVAIRESR